MFTTQDSQIQLKIHNLPSILEQDFFEPKKLLVIEQIFFESYYRVTSIITTELTQEQEQMLGMLIGQTATITLNWPNHTKQQYVGAIKNIHHRYLLDNDKLIIIIVPPYQLLKHHSPKGTYLNKEPTEIITDVFGKTSIRCKFQTEYDNFPKLEYTAQFLENSYQFIQRIMSEWGLIHWPEITKDGQPYLFITDTAKTYKTNNTLQTSVQRNGKLCYQIKKAKIVGPFDSNNEYQYKHHQHSGAEPGEYFLNLNQGQAPVNKNIEYRTHYPDTHWQYWGAYCWGQRHQMHKHNIYGSKNPEQRVGTTWPIQYYQREKITNQLITKSILYVNLENDAKIHNKITTQLGHQRHYPPAIERPRIRGPQIAIVTTELTEQDRINDAVRVYFPWDQNHESNTPSTPWLKVMQPIAGPNTGILFTPRKNSEVVVTYINDDYQRPIIQTSLNNQKQQTWQKHTINGIETRTINQQKGKNQILLDDENDNESITITAEKDLKIHVNNDLIQTIGGDRTIVIGQNAYQIIKEGNSTLKIKQGNYKVLAKQGKIEYIAGEEITFETPGAKLVITPDNIKLEGKTVKLLTTNTDNIMPVARKDDQHLCPDTQIRGDNKIPHEKGTITTGSSNVFINNQPVATVDDSAECQIGPKNKITQGASNILINGKPLARLGDALEHGGTIIQGSKNVLAGGINKAPNPQPQQEPSLCEIKWERINIKTQEILAIPIPLKRNQAITNAYAQTYLNDNKLEWVGLAAVVSSQVGCRMYDAKKYSNASKPLSYRPLSYTPLYDYHRNAKDMKQALIEGNNAIFQNIYPVVQFYIQHGFEELQKCNVDTNGNKVPAELIQAFSHIENAKKYAEELQEIKYSDKMPRTEKIIEGREINESMMAEIKDASDAIAKYEQKVVVQGAIYDNPVYYKIFQQLQTDSWLSIYGMLGRIGVISFDIPLSAHCAKKNAIPMEGDITIADDRIVYYEKLMQAFQKKNHNILMQQIIDISNNSFIQGYNKYTSSDVEGIQEARLQWDRISL